MKIFDKRFIIHCFFVLLFVVLFFVAIKLNFFRYLTGIEFNDKKSYIAQVIPYLSNFANRLILNEVKEPNVVENSINDNQYFEMIDIDTDLRSRIYKSASKYDSMFTLDKYVYNFDKGAYVNPDEFLPLENLLDLDMSISITDSKPRILIFHTHSYEAYIDSRKDVEEDTVTGIGKVLADILTSKYKLPVIHDNRKFGSAVEEGQTYEKIEPYIIKILEKYPSIEVLIDIHRDGVPDNLRFVTQINGKDTAKIMFVNGVSRLKVKGEPVDYLPNPYLKENLAFSLQMKLSADDLYPDFTRRTFIKPYRYSLNMRPKSLLVEAGANTNTVEEVINAMEPLADVLVHVLFSNQNIEDQQE